MESKLAQVVELIKTVGAFQALLVTLPANAD